MPVPPAEVQRIARRALARRATYGRGGTAVGVARARDLAAGRNLSDETIQRMVSFFARHGANPDEARARADRTSAASIAWGLWGGTAGRRWAESELRKIRRAADAG